MISKMLFKDEISSGFNSWVLWLEPSDLSGVVQFLNVQLKRHPDWETLIPGPKV